jgi:Serine acetyltransferase
MIGDNVVLFSGAKIIGQVHIGNNVVVGANAVVLNDIPDNAVVAGVPAKIVSYNGIKITRQCYDSLKGQNK